MFDTLPIITLGGMLIPVVATLFYEAKRKQIERDAATRTREHLERTINLKQMHNDELKQYANKRDEEYLLNLYRCYCGDILREKALFCHKCGRRKGT